MSGAQRIKAQHPTAFRRPSARTQPKLLRLLAYEIEAAARVLRDGGVHMEDALRHIERQISFIREVCADVK